MKETKNKLASYVNALRPIIYINHFDFNIDTNDLVTVIEKTQPISKSLGEKIKIIQESLKKINFKPAS